MIDPANMTDDQIAQEVASIQVHGHGKTVPARHALKVIGEYHRRLVANGQMAPDPTESEIYASCLVKLRTAAA